MNDVETLLLAAKAGGYVVTRSRMSDPSHRDVFIENSPRNPDQSAGPFNAFTDCGDAFRLALAAGISIDMHDCCAWIRLPASGVLIQEYWGGDYDPCPRKAITLAAARGGAYPVRSKIIQNKLVALGVWCILQTPQQNLELKMSKTPDVVVKLSETLTLCEYQNPKNGSFGFWLYDKTRGMNLSMRAKTSTEAFVEALAYYQKRLTEVEKQHAELSAKVDVFVAQFTSESDDDSRY